MASDLKTIFVSQTKDEAMEKTKQVVKKWYLIEGKATESFRFNIEFCFTYFFHLLKIFGIKSERQIYLKENSGK